MVRQIALIILLLSAQVVYGQKNNVKKKALPPPNTAEDNNCIKKRHSSFTARLKQYPFNQSVQIRFVSFNGDIYLSDQDILQEGNPPRINDSILYAKLTEQKNLTYAQVDKLTDVLYNHGIRGNSYSTSITACYIPRNAIIFLDEHNKVIAFIEICFQCNKTSVSSEKISLGEMCDQKLDMLFNLFKTVGIEYGITKGVVPGDQE